MPLFDSRARLWRDPVGLDLSQAEFRRIADRIRWATRPRQSTPLHDGKVFGAWMREYRSLLLGIPAAAFVAYALVTAIMYARGPGRVMLIVSFAVMLASFVFGQLFAWRQRTRAFPRASELQIATAMLAEHRCPSCAYNIARVEPDADGCVVCPECAAAWHADRIRAVFAI